jgi:hypothetical protein
MSGSDACGHDLPPVTVEREDGAFTSYGFRCPECAQEWRAAWDRVDSPDADRGTTLGWPVGPAFQPDTSNPGDDPAASLREFVPEVRDYLHLDVNGKWFPAGWHEVWAVYAELQNGYSREHVGSRRLRVAFGFVDQWPRVVGVQMFEYVDPLLADRTQNVRIAPITSNDLETLDIGRMLQNYIDERNSLGRAFRQGGTRPALVDDWTTGYTNANAYGRPKQNPRVRQYVTAAIDARVASGEQRAAIVRELARQYGRDVSTINRWARSARPSTPS